MEVLSIVGVTNRSHSMKKPATPTALAAYLLQVSIDQFTRSPALRQKTGINLADLAQVSRVRRQLLRQPKQP